MRDETVASYEDNESRTSKSMHTSTTEVFPLRYVCRNVQIGV